MPLSITDFLNAQKVPSCYLYSGQQLALNYNMLAESLNDGIIAYSFKCNYSNQIIDDLKNLGAHYEVSSEMEYGNLIDAGIDSSRLIINAPVITSIFINKLKQGKALVNAQSETQLLELLDLNRIGVRIRLDDYPSRFGIDLNRLQLVVSDLNPAQKARIESIHLHLVTPERSVQNYTHFFEQLTQAAHTLKLPNLKSINLGGGFFSELHPEFSKQFNHYTAPNNYFELFKRLHSDWQLILEPGALLTANTISFCCRVTEINDSRIQLSGSIYDILPTKSGKQIPYIIHSKAKRAIKGTCYGFTCMEDDILIKTLAAPIEVGDWIQFLDIGAYAQNLRPVFIGPKAPEFRL